jgi:undecaprenyl-diphosphatase
LPSDLTIFAAKYLIFLDAILAAVVLLLLLHRRPAPDVVRWLVAAAIMALLALVFSTIGGAVYNDPRPFTQDHVKPLLAHAADNGFPSDHALLAAAVVGAFLLAAPLWSVPFAVLAVLIDWARVGAGVHHTGDVIGSSLFVAVAVAVAVAAGPAATRIVLPYLPASWSSEDASRASLP